MGSGGVIAVHASSTSSARVLPARKAAAKARALKPAQVATKARAAKPVNAAAKARAPKSTRTCSSKPPTDPSAPN